MKFSDLKISEKTIAALSKLGYEEPTEVQVKAIPEIVAGSNLLVRSQTGTGKTAAFGIGLIERLAAGKSRKVLVLTPTRELALQVCNEVRNIGQVHGTRVYAVYGGQSIERQVADIRRGVDILVATPGRLLDLGRRGVVQIGSFDVVVLDEADMMLDMGFIDEVSSILDQLPAQHLAVLLSATLEYSIMQMASKYVKNAKVIEIGEKEVVATVKEEYVEATDREKFARLIEVCRSHEGMKILIFRETKLGASRLEERLAQRGFKAGVLQGDMSQSRRNAVLSAFKEGRITVLVATNVAARGLHIDNLGLIINYDKAQTEEVHLHRVGRTGRMGTEGKAITFVQRPESRAERMSDEHPDFAWMKSGYRIDERRPTTHRSSGHGPPRHGTHRGPPHQGARPHRRPERRKY